MTNKFLDVFAKLICVDVDDWDSDFDSDGYTDILGFGKVQFTPDENKIFGSFFGLDCENNILDVRPHIKRQGTRAVGK